MPYIWVSCSFSPVSLPSSSSVESVLFQFQIIALSFLYKNSSFEICSSHSHFLFIAVSLLCTLCWSKPLAFLYQCSVPSKFHRHSGWLQWRGSPLTQHISFIIPYSFQLQWPSFPLFFSVLLSWLDPVRHFEIFPFFAIHWSLSPRFPAVLCFRAYTIPAVGSYQAL